MRSGVRISPGAPSLPVMAAFHSILSSNFVRTGAPSLPVMAHSCHCRVQILFERVCITVCDGRFLSTLNWSRHGNGFAYGELHRVTTMARGPAMAPGALVRQRSFSSRRARAAPCDHAKSACSEEYESLLEWI